MRVRDAWHPVRGLRGPEQACSRITQHDCHTRRDSGQGEADLKHSRGGTPGFDVTGPVQAEVFVLRLKDGIPELAGPCGPDPWYIEVGADDDPVEVVARLSARLMGPPLLVHSTSWRRDRGGVILSFVVVNAPGQAAELAGVPIQRMELARSSATAAAAGIATNQVLEHGLRHLAWLATDDPTVKATLDETWKHVLLGYVPEPFRHLT